MAEASDKKEGGATEGAGSGKRGGGAHKGKPAEDKIEMPKSITELYQVASTAMLDRLERKERSDTAPSGIIAIPHLRQLLEAVFFQAHAAERRIIRIADLETAALGLARTNELKAIQEREPPGED